MTEVEKLLEELVVMERESEMKKGQRNEEKKLVEGEKKKAVEMRERAMERLGQTKKRQKETETDE